MQYALFCNSQLRRLRTPRTMNDLVFCKLPHRGVQCLGKILDVSIIQTGNRYP